MISQNVSKFIVNVEETITSIIKVRVNDTEA